MTRPPGPPTGATTGAVGPDYYDQSGYFEEGAAHLLDPESRFQRYRIREVLTLCGDVTGKRAVDLGCGWGTISFALAERGADVVGVDFAEASIRICRSRQRRRPLPNLSFTRADATATGLPSAQWDLVVAADLIEHLNAEHTRAVYAEAGRLLRPGGRLVIWTPSPTHFLEAFRRLGILRADPTHIDYKTLDRVQSELRAAGFRVVTAKWAPSHLPVLSTLERFFQRWVPLLRRRVAAVGEEPKS